MTKIPLDELIEVVLSRQQEDGGGAELSEGRVREAFLLGGVHNFTDREKHLLATSPLARRTYQRVGEDVAIERIAAQRRWELAGIGTVSSPLLAAATSQKVITIRGSRDDFVVTIRSHPDSAGWITTLSLGDRFRTVVADEEVLSLVDEAGIIWVSGILNPYGEVHSYRWPYAEPPEKVVARRGFRLTIKCLGIEFPVVDSMNQN